MLYRPYQHVRDKAYMYRTRNTTQASDQFSYLETVPRAYVHNPDEDGAPD